MATLTHPHTPHNQTSRILRIFPILIAAALFCGCSDDSGKKSEQETCTQDKCENWCGDFKTDKDHCGNCETQCDPNEVCDEGSCKKTETCTQDKCENWCGDFQSDPKHCGDCATDCTIYEGVTGTCNEGKCEFTANLCKDETDLNGKVTQHKKICIKDGNPVCASIDTDPNNCGECENKCGGEEPVCIAGECGNRECSYTICGAKCVDLTQDDNYCGNCDTSCDTSKERCINGYCVPKTCVDTCSKQEIIDLGMSEDAFKSLFQDTNSVCIDPSDPGMCGITTCSELKTAISNKQKLGCEGELLCLQNAGDANKYSCSCPDGTFKHDARCLSPSDNRSCGATATNPGELCTAERGYCDPEKHTCSLCVGGRIACNTGNDGTPVIRCIDPETSKDFCGANLTCDKYVICNGENSQCVGGQCHCESGYAACGTENKGEGCKKLTDEDMMANHCGAKSGGQCNSKEKQSPDYMGMICENVDKTTCVLNEDTTYCGCPISVDNNYITCDDKCIFARSDVHYCGATDCKENRGVDCTEQIISNGFELSCSIGQCKCAHGGSGYPASVVSDYPDFVGSVCVDTLTDPKCCTEPGGVCQGNNCLEREGNMTCKDGICTEITCEADELYCNGKCVYNMTDCSNCVSGMCPVYEHGIVIGCRIPNTDDNCDSCGNVCKNGTHCKRINEKFGCKCDLTYSCKQKFGNETDGTPYCVDELPKHVVVIGEDCSCQAGFADLDGDFYNGCEIDLNYDKIHCGTIDNDCTKLPHVVNPRCEFGKCVYDRCENRYGNCDMDAPEGILGCEADLTQPATCGHCSHKCTNDRICNPMNNDCCYPNDVAYSHSLDTCCDNDASVWRECVDSSCLISKGNWMCSVEQPTGNWEKI